MSLVTEEKKALDQQRVEQFAGQFIMDLSANYSGVMILLGQELGLYQAMQGKGPLTSFQLARSTKTHERYIREWLNNQAAGGYVVYDAENKTYELPEEHALVLIEKDSPYLLAPAYFIVNSLWKGKSNLMEAFKSGRGIGWHEQHHQLFYGVEATYRTGYLANLNKTWIPSLEGMEEKLRHGARVADIGCGHGASTILMAEEFPNSVFYGYDYHRGSVEAARYRREEKRLKNVFFKKEDAVGYVQDNFNMICFFDCLHDFGNPLNVLCYARTKLASDGSLLIVEPNAGDKPEDNFNPVGRMFYAASTALCLPHSHSEEGGYCLGAQAGPAAIEKIVKEAGFSRFRIAYKGPINLVYEVKA